MSKQVTIMSPKLFIGTGIHKITWKNHFTTVLVEGAGHTFPPDTQKVKKYVERNYSDYEVSVAYEGGCCGSLWPPINLSSVLKIFISGLFTFQPVHDPDRIVGE